MKKSVLEFCIAAQDLGLVSPSDKISSQLKNLHYIFEEKLKQKLHGTIMNILMKEDYNGLQIMNKDELRDKLDKYEIDLDDYFRTNKKTETKYPLNLNFT